MLLLWLLILVPEDYEDRANNDLWDWDANQEKVEEAEKLLRETDRCCFCDFDCPPPSEQENKKRYFGVLESLSDHIELAHPLAYEWLGWSAYMSYSEWSDIVSLSKW